MRVILALVSLAVYAPWLANDQPYLLQAVDRGAFERACGGLDTVLQELTDAVEEGAEPDRLLGEQRALALRLEVLRTYLPRTRRSALDRLEAGVERLIEAGASGERLASVRAEADQVRALCAGEVPLESTLSFPLLASLTAGEVFFMVLWGCLLWFLWRGIPMASRSGWARLAWTLLIALGAAGVWRAWGATPGALLAAQAKEGLSRQTIEAERVWFPPLRLGYAETHLSESFRPPTWTSVSRIDEAGHYESGPRRPVPDPVTGFVRGARPIDVRYGEPGRNSPWRHPLGTDELGRDLLVRLLWGARVSLAVGFFSSLLLVVLGASLGAAAGYFGGAVDLCVSRSIEVVQSIPAFFLILAAVALIPESSLHPLFAIVLVIALVRWTGMARLVRAEVLKLKHQDFVLAARSSGYSSARVVFVHLLPNALGPVLVAATFAVAAGILLESGVSFLGFGVKHPFPSWGSLINESRSLDHWWIQLFPGACIFLTVLCTNIVGEGLRDAVDPRRQV